MRHSSNVYDGECCLRASCVFILYFACLRLCLSGCVSACMSLCLCNGMSPVSVSLCLTRRVASGVWTCRVQGLMDAGVSVDSYGRCLHNREEGRREGGDRNGGAKKIDLLRQYKFAIAFENSPLTVRPQVPIISYGIVMNQFDTHIHCSSPFSASCSPSLHCSVVRAHTGLYDREIHAGAHCRGDPDHSRTAEYQRFCPCSRLIHCRRVFRLASAAGAGSTYSV